MDYCWGGTYSGAAGALAACPAGLVAFGSRWTGGAVPGASYRCAAAGEFIYCGGVWYFGPAGSH